MQFFVLSTLLFCISLVSGASIAVRAPLAPELTPRAANDTENQLSGPCRPVTFIFARGTGEDGNVGARVGPPLIADLRAALGADGIAAQGVDYDAKKEDLNPAAQGISRGGSPSGSATMATLINTAASQCPDTQIVIGGYSQGAQLVHNAAATLNASVTARIAAVVTFGDPRRVESSAPPVGTIPLDKVYSDCHTAGIYYLHRTRRRDDYDEDAPTATAFIVGSL
ncbi:cutinase-domain-containing protein [Mycena sanguinolenta]|nr:cutinase-domain-containing protein [Mycena sanguinolenta]